MNQITRDDIILAAALEFGPDHHFEIRNGTLGLTLYVHVANKHEAKAVRAAVPLLFRDLRTIVTYNNNKFDNDK